MIKEFSRDRELKAIFFVTSVQFLTALLYLISHVLQTSSRRISYGFNDGYRPLARIIVMTICSATPFFYVIAPKIGPGASYMTRVPIDDLIENISDVSSLTLSDSVGNNYSGYPSEFDEVVKRTAFYGNGYNMDIFSNCQGIKNESDSNFDNIFAVHD